MSARPDLLHLSPEAIAHATNAGIVKRATRELEGGYRPHWDLDEHATLTARFPDGIVTTWPQGKPIEQANCTCGAAKVCRHRVVAALVFREAAAQAATVDVTPRGPLSPGQVPDTSLVSLIPASLMQLARQELASGLSVEIRRTAAGEPCDTARLPASTIRFWSGAAIETARCDCIRGVACEHVALAVWAFRQADAEHPGVAAVQVRLGNEGGRAALDRAPYQAWVETLLRHGVSQGATPMVQTLSLAFTAARSAGANWLDLLLGDIETWSNAYANRSSLYQPEQGLDLITELALRTAAGNLPGNARSVLGIGQPGETELDRLRLLCIGARTLRDGEIRRTRMILADADTGTRLVLTKEWSVPDSQFAHEATIRASERVAPGVRLEQLAQGQLLAQQARRLADGSLKLAKARSSQNSVLPQAADWNMLAAPLRLSQVRELVAHKQANPTEQLLPRHAAGQFLIFTPHQIEHVLYDPAEQTLTAMMRDQEDQTIIVRRAYENHVRNALDAFAGALAGNFGPLRHVAGTLRWMQGHPVIEPWAFACDSVVVPDFADACGALAEVPIGHVPLEAEEPVAPAGDSLAGSPLGIPSLAARSRSVTRALRNLRRVLAILLHHGVTWLPRSWADDSAEAVRQLRGLSLHALSQRFENFAHNVLLQQVKSDSAGLAAPLMELAALLQLHEAAQVIARITPPEAPRP